MSTLLSVFKHAWILFLVFIIGSIDSIVDVLPADFTIPMGVLIGIVTFKLFPAR